MSEKLRRYRRRKDEKRFIDKLVNYTAANIRLNEIYPVRVLEINLFFTPSLEPLLHATPNTFTFHFITSHRLTILQCHLSRLE